MIGTKTVAMAIASAVAIAACVALGVSSGGGALLWAGTFGVVVGTAMFRFWRLGEKSARYVRFTSEPAEWDVPEAHFIGSEKRRLVIGDNERGEAFDAPPVLQHVASVVVAFVLAVGLIDARAIDHLARARASASAMTSSFCPEEKTETTKKPPPGRDPNEPGCELVRRAYALGYAKSLGACAPKAKLEAESRPPPCTRRQRDEPLLHYWWRLLAGFGGRVKEIAGRGYLTKAQGDFRARVAHVGALASSERRTLASAPHAAHHVWTNLPDPGDTAFGQGPCGVRYARVAHRPMAAPGPHRASKIFEHVLAQLLFEQRYDAPAANCREVHVHFGAAPDTCKRLARDPAAFLASDESLGDVRAVVDRWAAAKELAALGSPAPSKDASAYVTFQCYFEGLPPARTTTPIALLGHAFTVDEIAVATTPPDSVLTIDRYDALASLLSRGFHYANFLSEARVDRGALPAFEAAFTRDDELLTRLYELEGIDIYVDPGWLARRPDVLEVYPYERHLRDYVEAFRKEWRRARGRL